MAARTSHDAARTERVRVLGCPVDSLTMAQTLDRCVGIIDAGEPTQQVSVNAAKLVAARTRRTTSGTSSSTAS